MAVRRTLAVLAAVALLAASPAPPRKPPATAKIPVADPLFGPAAVDPYRWLEADDAPRVRAWVAAQRAYAQTFLESQRPYAALRARIAQLARTRAARSGLQIRGTHFVYERITPPQEQSVLVARDGIQGTERVLYDPQTVARDAPPEAIESIFPSPDGSRVAFTTQAGGTEDETLHVVDEADGTLAPDTIAHAGGGVSGAALVWDGDGNGFTYTRLPLTGPAEERRFNNHLYHHALGTDPASDAYVFGEGQSRVAEYILLSSPDGLRTAALVEPGDLGDYAVFVRDGNGPFQQVATVADHVRGAIFLGETLLLKTSKRHGTFDVLALGGNDTFDTAPTLIAATPLPIEKLDVVGGSLFATLSDGGESVLHHYDPSGRDLGALPLPEHISVSGIAGDPETGPAIVAYSSYDTPGNWVSYDAATGKVMETGIETTPPADYSKLIVTRRFVPSSDGAKIPLTTIQLPSAQPGGSAPTLLTAYGGYGIITAPHFIGTQLAWLERGGVLAVAAVRGGGEYGEDWHLAAVRATKTKSADDLAACARWLGANGYGDARHLGIFGGSDGGFLMGLAITRDPSLYRAVVAFVGIYDIPRWQLSPNGASNIPEFGDAKNPSDFAYIRKQSPYQNVRDGIAYPAMLMITGENDPRVSPMNSRKMTARLQAATASRNPILLIQSSGAGHGIGASFDQRVTQQTQMLVFFSSQLDLP